MTRIQGRPFKVLRCGDRLRSFGQIESALGFAGRCMPGRYSPMEVWVWTRGTYETVATVALDGTRTIFQEKLDRIFGVSGAHG